MILKSVINFIWKKKKKSINLLMINNFKDKNVITNFFKKLKKKKNLFIL